MHLMTFKRLAPQYYTAGKSLYLTSAPGRGKTTTVIASVEHIAQKLNKTMGLVILSGPLLTPIDTLGYLIPKHNDDGTVEARYTQPFWFRTEEGKLLSEYDGGIIFVDEADKMEVDVKKIVGEMALSGRCGPHRLPKGWVVWMAGNRAGDRSGSTRELDHLINRRFEIPVTDDLLGWEAWAHDNGVHPDIITFAMQNPQIVFAEKLPEKQGPFCTPRSLVATGEMLVTLGGNGNLATDSDAVEIAAGGIGEAAAAQLFATIRLASELPDFEEIIERPGEARMPVKVDAQMLVAYRMAAVASKETLTPIIKYVRRLPADLQTTFGKAMIRRVPALGAHPSFVAWIKDNAALVAMIANRSV